MTVAADRKKGRPRKGKYLPCVSCGTEFYTYQNSTRKYCTHQCSADAASKKVFDAEKKLKKCAMCQEWKTLSEFPNANNKASGPHGKQAYCRPCNLIKSNEWADGNKEAKREHSKSAYWRNPEKMRLAARSIPDEQRKRKNKGQRAYALTNAEKVRAWNKARFHTLRAAGKITISALLLMWSQRTI